MNNACFFREKVKTIDLVSHYNPQRYPHSLPLPSAALRAMEMTSGISSGYSDLTSVNSFYHFPQSHALFI